MKLLWNFAPRALVYQRKIDFAVYTGGEVMFRYFIAALVLSFLLSACALQQAAPTPTPTPTATATLQVNNALPVSLDGQDPNLCYFSPYGIGSPFDAYEAPISETEQGTSVGMVESGQLYTALSKTDLWYQIVVSAGVTGWVRYGTGGLTGNCDSLPAASFRPPTPEGVCAVYFDSVTPQDNIYVDQEGTLVVEARSRTATLRVRLSDGRTGWLLTPDQLLYARRALSGNCESLPVEESNVIGG
jgi:hypothetical protein